MVLTGGAQSQEHLLKICSNANTQIPFLFMLLADAFHLVKC